MPKRTGEPDLDVDTRARARELRVHKSTGVEVRGSGELELESAGERHNLPLEPEKGETYRDVEVRGGPRARLRKQ